MVPGMQVGSTIVLVNTSSSDKLYLFTRFDIVLIYQFSKDLGKVIHN